MANKETLELVEAVKILFLTHKEIMKDGKIDLNDSPAVVKFVSQADVVIAGFTGLSALPAEAKAYARDEVHALVDKLFDSSEEYHKA